MELQRKEYIRCHHLLEVCFRRKSGVYPLAYLAYTTPRGLFASDNAFTGYLPLASNKAFPMGALFLSLRVEDSVGPIRLPVNIW